MCVNVSNLNSLRDQRSRNIRGWSHTVPKALLVHVLDEICKHDVVPCRTVFPSTSRYVFFGVKERGPFADEEGITGVTGPEDLFPEDWDLSLRLG